MHERRRRPQFRQAATGVAERRRAPPQLAHLGAFEPGDGIGVGEERVELPLEDVEPPVEAAGREEVVHLIRSRALELREPLKRLDSLLERRTPADRIELGQQQPPLLRLDGERGRHVAREAGRERRGNDALLDEERQPRRHLEVEVRPVGARPQDGRDAPLLHLLDAAYRAAEARGFGTDPLAHRRFPAGPRPGGPPRRVSTVVAQVLRDRLPLVVSQPQPVEVVQARPAPVAWRCPLLAQRELDGRLGGEPKLTDEERRRAEPFRERRHEPVGFRGPNVPGEPHAGEPPLAVAAQEQHARLVGMLDDTREDGALVHQAGTMRPRTSARPSARRTTSSPSSRNVRSLPSASAERLDAVSRQLDQRPLAARAPGLRSSRRPSGRPRGSRRRSTWRARAAVASSSRGRARCRERSSCRSARLRAAGRVRSPPQRGDAAAAPALARVARPAGPRAA